MGLELIRVWLGKVKCSTLQKVNKTFLVILKRYVLTELTTASDKPPKCGEAGGLKHHLMFNDMKIL